MKLRNVAVVARNYNEYREWCVSQMLSGELVLKFDGQFRTETTRYVCVRSADSLRGLEIDAVERVGAWLDRDDLAEIERALKVVVGRRRPPQSDDDGCVSC